MKGVSTKNYNSMITDIGSLLELGRKQAYQAVNSILVRTYWGIGKRIVEYERKNKEDGGYGSRLFEKIAKDLRNKYGRGFSRSNLIYMRLIFLKYPKSQTLSDQLSWSHYIELLSVEDDLERGFYEKMCLSETWSVRELDRQIESALYHRFALGRDKQGVIALSQKGQIISKANDVIKNPYILEFLRIPQDHEYSEREIEQKIIDNLQMFLLELGKGFTFVARQKKISIGNKHFYVDLVFYHRILKCFVLIDLKIGEASHMDVGQMNLYLNYFKKEENSQTDSEPIGIILSAGKNDVLIEYALGSITNQLFISKYKLHLPDKKELEEQLRRALA